MKVDLLYVLEQLVPLNDEEKELIINSFRPLHLKKGEFFLRAGTVNRSVAFLQSGLVRYFVLKNDEESTFEFTKEGEFVCDYQSFNNRSPSIQNIEAIEDCELLVIDYPKLQNIFKNSSNGNLLGRLIVEHRFDIMVNQLLSVYMHSHEERYKRFIANYSDLAQRIPQYLIASYVGVQAPSLSRIRKRFAKDIS